MNPFHHLLASRGITSPPTADVRVIGIDLGTTNSTVSEVVWKAGRAAPEPVRTLDIDQKTASGLYTSPLVPSVVSIRDGERLVGEGAKVLRGRMGDESGGSARNRDIFWECKNQMGVQRTYHQAPQGFRSPREIGGQVLNFLLEGARKDNPAPIARSVVTVPASFRIAQRQDTQKAAELADISIGPGDLIDEPVAVFLDYICSHDISRLELNASPKNILVFDFGGGTCDVAVFRLSIAAEGRIAMAPLSVSRYFRLGGGDLDAAIVHEVLIPQIIAQNNLSPFELGYEDKTKQIEPALLSIAEALKSGLCGEISRLMRLGRYPEGADRKTVFKRNPGATFCTLKNGRTLKLEGPVLTAEDFDKLLAPFLDRDFLFARETDYRMTCSIFAPLTDAINRAGLSPGDISVCLMAGGSSFVPRIQQEMDLFFSNGYVLNFASPEDAKLCVSRGAVCHAFALQLAGCGAFEPIVSDTVLLQTNSGPVQIVPSGTALPYPGPDKWAEAAELKVPQFGTGIEKLLRLEMVTPDQMKLAGALWKIPKEVSSGTALRFRYLMDANQLLRIRLNVASAPEGDFWEWEFESPLVNIEYPDRKREEVEELEEKIRTGCVPRPQIPDTLVRVAELTADLGQRERALGLMEKALAAKKGSDAGLLNKMAILCGDMRDHGREAKFYQESARIVVWAPPLFNLALSLHRRRLFREAVPTIEEALVRRRDAPTLVLRAMIADGMQESMRREECLREAMKSFGDIQRLSDWELGWYITAARMSDHPEKVKEASEEQKRRGKRKDSLPVPGLLPDRGGA